MHLLVIVPPYRLTSCTAILFDRIIVAQLAELPDHLRAGCTQQKSRIERRPTKTCRLIAFDRRDAPRFRLVHRAFFVVAFLIRHQTMLSPAARGCTAALQAAAVLIAHGRLAIGVIHVVPEQHPVVGQFLFFFVFAEMFEDRICFRVDFPNMRMVIFQNRNT